MRTKNELYQQALRTVAMRRQTARALAQDAQAEAEAAIPGLRHAEEEVRVRGIRCAIAGASGKDRTEAAAALAAAKQKLTALLAESGRPADALEPKFTCKRCEDTGAVDGHTCDCVRRVMQQLRRKEIEELSSLSISSFDTMQLDYYPNTVDKTLGGRKAIARWYEVYGYDDAMVQEAAVQAGPKRDLWYWNSILKTWNAKGLRSIHDVRGPVAAAGASRNIRVDRAAPSGNDILKNATRRRSLIKKPE